MIRKVEPQDVNAISCIYNKYIAETDITFETEQLDNNEISNRINSISDTCPYLVYIED